LLFVVAFSAPGCDEVHDAWQAPELEATLRTEPGRQGKVGTLRALGVRGTAMSVARRIAAPVIEDCQRTLGKAESRRARFEVRRLGEDGTELMVWREQRVLEHGPKGVWRDRWQADFTTLAGTSGRRGGDVVSDDSRSWIRRDPGNLWYEADLPVNSGRSLDQRLNDLLGLATWRKDGPARWSAGQRSLRCIDVPPDRAWLPRVAANGGTLVRQRLEFGTDETRQIELEWTLPDQTALIVYWGDSPRHQVEEAIALPAGEAVVDVERDLSYNAARQAIVEWINDGSMERVSDGSNTTE
jgi:hypothetical protein